MTRSEPPLVSDDTKDCSNCEATLPGNLVSRDYCQMCIDRDVEYGFRVLDDVDNSNYRHPET